MPQCQLKVDKGRSSGGVLRGIIWHQGESDSGSEEDATNYAERLHAVIHALRMGCGDVDLPMLLGELPVRILEYGTILYCFFSKFHNIS